jgi:signal transduction histidine kinase
LFSEICCDGSPSQVARMKTLVPARVLVPLLLGLGISGAVLIFAERGYERLESANQRISKSLELQSDLNELRALVTDAETAQRGYLLTGDKRYLEPYKDATPKIMSRFIHVRDRVMQRGSAAQQTSLFKLEDLIRSKIAGVEETIAVFEKFGGKAALARTETDVGNRTMEAIRDTIDAMAMDERTRLYAGFARWDQDITTLRVGLQLMTVSAIALLVTVLVLARRELAARARASQLMIEDQRRLESEVERRTAELAALSTHLQDVREEEKRKLARDLHDELGSLLISAKMDASWVKGRLPPDQPGAVSERLEAVLGLLDEAVQIKRRIIEELRPTLLDTVGLVAALEWQVGEACQRAGISWEVTASGVDDDEIPADVSIALFRVAQEAVTNAVRHARARNFGVDVVRVGDELTLVIRDDGIGISEGALQKGLSHGVAGMRQRVRALRGFFRIRGHQGAGTVIEVRITLDGAGLRNDAAPDQPESDVRSTAIPSSTSRTRS